MNRLKSCKFAALLLSLMLTVICLPVSAAEGASSFSSPIVLTEASPNTTVTGTWSGNITASKDSPKAVITIRKGFNGILTLDGVTIKNLGDYVAAIQVESGAKPIILVQNSNVLQSGTNRAGIEVGGTARLNIAGTGLLTVQGGANGAGIGGGNGMTGGTINIADYYDSSRNSTRIVAVGGSSAAGIGGGFNGGGGTVTVEGGYVRATGSGSAQDIGRGVPAQGNTLAIGTTLAHGGRIVNCTKVDWSPTDTAVRREAKVKVEIPSDKTDHGYVRIDVKKPVETYLNIMNVPNEQGLKETDVAYLYLPERNRVITLSITALGYDNMVDYVYGTAVGETLYIRMYENEDDR